MANKQIKVSDNQVISKSRKWFLTINNDSVCYPSIKEILKSIENLNYSLMLHDKDNQEQPHYHLVLDYKNARTFEQVQKVFQGSHIEVLSSMYMSCRYLLHLDDKDKHQYPIEELFTNNNQVEYFINNDEFEKLTIESLLENIETFKVFNMTTAVKKYGLRQVNLHRNLITELIQENVKMSGLDNQYQLGYDYGYSKAQEELEEEVNNLHNYIYVLEQQIKDLEKNKNLFNS